MAEYQAPERSETVADGEPYTLPGKSSSSQSEKQYSSKNPRSPENPSSTQGEQFYEIYIFSSYQQLFNHRAGLPT